MEAKQKCMCGLDTPGDIFTQEMNKEFWADTVGLPQYNNMKVY